MKSFLECGLGSYTHWQPGDSSIHDNGGIFYVKTGSSYAQQGTDAHEIGAYKIEKALGHRVRDPTDDLTYFDEEMAENTDSYAEFVMEQVAEAKQSCPDPLVLVEQRLDFSRWVPESFDTGDCVIIADDVMTVIELKYGVGVIVNAENNSQMRMYALGALNLFESIYDIQRIRTIIYQPRRDNISIAEVTKEELLRWADETELSDESSESGICFSYNKIFIS